MTHSISREHSDERPALLDLLEQFEENWHSPAPISLARFWQATLARRPSLHESERRQLLLELIHVDLEYRWRRSQGLHDCSSAALEDPATDQAKRPLTVEQWCLRDYARLFPELGPVEALPPDLIVHEYRRRRLAGDPPGHAPYLAQWPQYATALLAGLVIVDRELDAEQEPAPSSSVKVEVDTVDERAAAKHDTAGDQVAAAEAGPMIVSAVELIAGYEILGELGRGGMGVVYKARQVGLNRLVALKMIIAGAHAGLQQISRFRTEAEAVARLQHPGIVQIYEIGEHNGLPFFSLEFCPGGSLAQQLRGAPQNPRHAARLVETLAWGVDAAHKQGIVHRDLKPANVLLAADNTPKISDFGLAKKLDEAGQTATGDILGTPSYMAPEQAMGRISDLGPLTDVYALGAILYELLTGRPPFRGESVLDTLELVREQEPVAPRRLQPKLPRDLETICLKCLHKEPRNRYQSAAALAEDLRRFQAGEPILARPVGVAERCYRWCRRNPRLAASLGFVVMTVGVATAWLMVAYGEVRTQRDKARERLRNAKETVDEFCTDVSESKEMKAKGTEQLRTKLLTSAVKFYERFVVEETGDEALQADRGRSYTRLADMYRQTGKNDASEQAYRQALAIQQGLADVHPLEPRYQQDLRISHTHLGILYMDTRRFDRAEEEYGSALAVQQRIVDAHPGEVEHRYPLALTHNNLGVLYLRTRRVEEAGDAFGKALAILKQLEVVQAAAPRYRRTLAKTYINQGTVFFDLARVRQADNAPEKAEEAFRQAEDVLQRAVDIARPLAAAYPDVLEYHEDLAQACYNLGLVYGQTGRKPLSEQYYREAVAVQQELADTHPTVLEYSFALGSGYSILGYQVRDRGAIEESLDLFGNAIRILAAVLKKEPRHSVVRIVLRDAHLGRAQALDRLGRHVSSVDDWDRSIEMDDGGMGIYLRFNRAATRARMGDHARAVSDVNELAQIKDLDHAKLYHLARVCALASAAVRQDSTLMPAARDDLFKQYSAQAVALVRRANEAGYFKNPDAVANMKKDKDMAAILSSDEFKQLLTELQSKTPPGKK